MKPVNELLRDWFGYSRRERRSAFILLLIIITVILLRIVVPDRGMSPEEISLNFTYKSYNHPPVTELQNIKSNPQKIQNKERQRVVELNTCDSAALVSLPGIGPVLSGRIIKFRKLLGGYVAVSQLKEVYGLSPETYELVSSRITADTLAVRKIKVNTAVFSELVKHPYFKRTEVTAILKFRELKGSIKGIGEMLENNLISEETAKKIGGYLDF